MSGRSRDGPQRDPASAPKKSGQRPLSARASIINMCVCVFPEKSPLSLELLVSSENYSSIEMVRVVFLTVFERLLCAGWLCFASHSGFESDVASGSAAETGAGAGSSGALAASEEEGSSGCAVEEGFSG